MANTVTLQTTFLQWKDIINEIITESGDLTTLPTTDQSSLVNALIELDDDITIFMSDVGDLTNLNTTTQTSIVSAINELVTALSSSNGNITTNATNIGTIVNLSTSANDTLVNAINELNVLKADKISQTYVNRDQNAGRFATETGLVATTTDSGLLSTYNASTLSIVDKFIDDNSTNGGAGSPLPANVISLMTELVAAGRTDQLNGYEFFILDVTAGAGVVDGINEASVDYYPILENNKARIGRIGQNVTWQGWVKVGTASQVAVLGDANTLVYIDGSIVSNPYTLAETDGWVFVKLVTTLTNEYNNLFPSIRCIDGTVVHIALTGIFDGLVNIPSHLGLV